MVLLALSMKKRLFICASFCRQNFGLLLTDLKMLHGDKLLYFYVCKGFCLV
jgi:hypothetical protein